MGILLILGAIIAVVGSVTVAGSFVVGAAAVSRNNKKRNQVVPGVSSDAPASWSGSHEPEAVLHRRIRDAVAGLHSIAGNDTSMKSTIESVDKDALDLDRQLIATSLLAPRFKPEALAELAEAVDQLEEITAQAVGRSARSSERSIGEQLDNLSDRLESMRMARAEVDEADRRGQAGQT